MKATNVTRDANPDYRTIWVTVEDGSKMYEVLFSGGMISAMYDGITYTTDLTYKGGSSIRTLKQLACKAVKKLLSFEVC